MTIKLDSFDGLVVFQAVARQRSFTAAARSLEVTTQAVSKAIKQLEHRLGVRLFHRTTRSVSLNEAGEALLARVAPALTDLAEATEALQAFRDKPAGLLRLAVSHPAFHAVLLPALPAFGQTYPDIVVELSFDEAFVDIVAQGLDAGIRLGDSIEQDMVSVRCRMRSRRRSSPRPTTSGDAARRAPSPISHITTASASASRARAASTAGSCCRTGGRSNWRCRGRSS